MSKKMIYSPITRGAELGLEKIVNRENRNRITWCPYKEVCLRSNARVFNELKEGETT